MARSLRLFGRRQHSGGALSLILPRLLLVGLLGLTVYYLLHKTHQRLNS
jgi:Tfp pilus assembly protein PilX